MTHAAPPVEQVPTFRITYSGPKDRARRRHRAYALAAAAATSTAVIGMLLPSPLAGHHDHGRDDVVRHATTTANALANCGQWQTMTDDERRIGAEHMLVTFGHADGSRNPADYSRPDPAKVDALAVAVTSGCVSVEPERSATRVALAAYTVDVSMH